MRMLSRVAILLVAFMPALAGAQDTPMIEIFSGFSYAHANFMGAGQKNSSFDGWNASVTADANRWLGVEADFAGHYGSNNVQLPVLPGTCPPICLPSVSVDTKAHEFLFGPRFSYRRQKITPFTHILFGATHVTESVTLPIPIPTLPINFSTSQTGFTMALGGGFDLPITKNLAWHNQADYLLTRLFSQTENNMRVSTGIAFRF
jgi:Outer membrane protein beta-barrel domain